MTRRWRTGMWTLLRFWAGKFLNSAGVPGVILSGTYEAGIGRASVQVTLGPLFTVVTVNGVDVYFHRLTGAVDGVGFTAPAGYTPVDIPESEFPAAGPVEEEARTRI